MAENKFIKHLKGTATAGAVLEVKNQGTPATFGNMPSGTSNLNTAYADARGDATGVLKGTDNWKLNGSTLTLATQVYGDGRDLTGTYTASGSSLWVNAIYTFDSAKIFNANTKWVLKLCGANLLSGASNTIDFSLVVKFGGLPVIAKTFTVAEQANNFCQQFVVDFAESPDSAIKVMAGDTMTIQLLCGDSTASATIYNGMTTVTALQRRVDGDVVASDTSTFADLEQNVVDIYDALNTKVSKSGDTMTGTLISNKSIETSDVMRAGKFLRFTSDSTLGSSTLPWPTAYIQTINNGSNLAVPNPGQADTLALHSEITGITDLIPAQATTTNQLADKDFVNSSVATNTANFIGTFNSVADLEAYSGTLTNNDYAFVVGTDGDGNTVYNRYKYTTATTPASWVFEYALNNSSFTAAQWATINSGATSSDVALARSAVQPSGVGNGTITITQGGTAKGTFTTNQGGNTTIDLDSGGGSGYNVGDTFMTKRTDNELNGAVECDGATYNTTDFTGTESIGALLEAGKLDYVSLSAYSTAISTKGWCDKIGWDGAGNTVFRVPTLNAHIVQTNNIPVVGNGMTLGLSDGNLNVGLTTVGGDNVLRNRDGVYGVPYGSADAGVTSINGKTLGITTDPTKSGIIADTSDTAQLRVMVQLAVGATDQALETCTSVLADVAELKYDYVVDFQAPTAANNYTWYRKYKSGWVEQGGQTNNTTDGAIAITLPVELADANYIPLITGTYIYDTGLATNNGASKAAGAFSDRTTTGFNLWKQSPVPYGWEIRYMAASQCLIWLLYIKRI